MAKILMVDDDRHLANLTKTVLVKKGYEVALLHEGLHVLEELKKHKPDLILMDIMMPKLSGAEVVKLLRKDPDLKSIPVIFLTALISGAEDIELEGVNIEGSNYQSLGKPYEIEHLIKTVEKALTRAGK